MKWYQSKSNITAIITAVLNVVATITGTPLPAWVNEALIGLWAIFMRMGVEKSGPQT